MKRVIEQAGQINLQRIIINDVKLPREIVAQLRQRGQTAAIAFHRSHPRPGLQQRPRQTARSGPHFEYALPVHVAGYCGNPFQQLHVEQEILTQRLVRGQAMFLDHLP